MPKDPKAMCRCGHEREWHNSCSRCYCPWFLAAGVRVPAGELKSWREAAAVRAAREG